MFVEQLGLCCSLSVQGLHNAPTLGGLYSINCDQARARAVIINFMEHMRMRKQ